MIRASFDADSLARVRLAASPVAEVSAWLGLTAGGGRHPVFGDPGAAARSALSDPAAAMVAAVLPPRGRPGYTPDLLTPKPTTARADRVLDEQLDRIASTPAEDVAQQVGWTGLALPRPVRDAVDRGTFAADAAHGLRRFWAAAIADGWTRLRSVMEADLAERAATMATRGVGAMFDSLHRDIGWSAGTLTVASAWREEFSLTGVEVVCAPAVLAWPTLSVQLCDQRDAVLGYPAAGIGARGRGSGDRSVDKLLGPSRAALLRDLDVPRSTAALAKRQHLAPATVSYHLKVLHRAGLVRSSRDGQYVLYHRTEAGGALAPTTESYHPLG
ncbi:MAG TPA: helix-turn-helix domain-containing protein [Actinophytocola sp.]|nr:helix-turn-helix domain-containing protein [Actinophytocola sp.]